MLNVYSYHTNPKSLKAPSEQIIKQWADEHKTALNHFANDMYALQDDYNVRIANNTKPNGDTWWSARWGRGSEIEFYIPADKLVVYEVDYTGNIINTHYDMHDMVNELADMLHKDGVWNEEDDYDEDDEYDGAYNEDDDD